MTLAKSPIASVVPTPSPSLEQRIAAALAPDADHSAGELQDLMIETVAAIDRAAADADRIKHAAHDPALTPDLSKARQLMEDAAFAVERLRTLLPRLEERHRAVDERETAARWTLDAVDIEAVRDRLAAEFTAKYPQMIADLADLLARMAACDAEIRRLHHRRPINVAKHLASTECTARGIGEFSLDCPEIAKALVLPGFADPRHNAWPPRAAFDPAMFAPPPFDPRATSGNWWQVAQEQRAWREKEAPGRAL